MRFIRIFKAFLAGLASRKASLASARVASGCISKSTSDPPPAGPPRMAHFPCVSRGFAHFGNPPKGRPRVASGCISKSAREPPQGSCNSLWMPLPAHFILIFKHIFPLCECPKALPESGCVASGCISTSASDPPQLEPSRCPKTLCFKRFCPPRASPRRLAFQSAPGELSIFASADPCRKLAILHSENDHLGHFCLKVAPRASKPRFSPLRTPVENWLFYRAKMTVWDTFASKSLPGPQSLDFRLRGPLPKTGHSIERK